MLHSPESCRVERSVVAITSRSRCKSVRILPGIFGMREVLYSLSTNAD